MGNPMSVREDEIIISKEVCKRCEYYGREHYGYDDWMCAYKPKSFVYGESFGTTVWEGLTPPPHCVMKLEHMVLWDEEHEESDEC